MKFPDTLEAIHESAFHLPYIGNVFSTSVDVEIATAIYYSDELLALEWIAIDESRLLGQIEKEINESAT